MSFSTVKTLSHVYRSLLSGVRQFTALSTNVKVILPTCARSETRLFSTLTRQAWSNTGAAMMVSGPSRLTQTGFGACNCGGCCGVHTKSDKDLSEFLTEEIEAEKSTVQQPGLPNVDGFDISTDGSVVTMVKAFNSEKVTLTFNVSNTVDVGAQEGQFEAKDEKGAEASSMVSKPDFTVEVKKGNQTLVFQCSIIDDMEQSAEGGETQEDGYADSFQIDEVAIHESEYTDSTYTVSADIMDGNLYDLFMNFLDERGVKNDFSDKLVQYATAYEHKLYIGLLEKLKGFVSS